jgi:hypothetical protein
MLLFIYFNPIIGPDLLYSVPNNIAEIISEENLDQIKRLMDAATPGFFTHAFSSEMQTANYFFMIPSAWARGKQEMVMVSKIIEEEFPNLASYETEFKDFILKLKTERPTIYMALYKDNPPLNYEEEIQQELEHLHSELDRLSKFFSISQAQTHGILMPFSDIQQTQSIDLPMKIINELEAFLEGKRNSFIVFQRRKDNFKIDVIPYDQEIVIKVGVIFNGQLSPETLKDIGVVFQNLNLPFVYTSGICQHGGNCIYEVYLNPENFSDFDTLRKDLQKIRNVEEVKIIEIML